MLGGWGKVEKVAKPLEDSPTQPVFCTHLQPDLQLASTSFHFPLPELSRLGLSWLVSVTWGIYFSKRQVALKRMSSDQPQPWLLLRTTRGYDPQRQSFLTLSVTGWQQSGVVGFSLLRRLCH